MGVLSVASIISTALDLAGNTGLTVPAQTWLETWLRETYAKYNWPFLYQEVTATLMAGSTSGVVIGNSTSQRVRRAVSAMIGDPSGTNNGLKQDIPIVDVGSIHPADHQAWVDSTVRGTPSKLLLRSDETQFAWNVYPDVVPDKAYRLIIRCQRIPDDPVSGAGGSTANVPVYPNDETMMQAVIVRALFHQNDERYIAEEAKLGRLLAHDFVVYGKRPGSQVLGLSRHKFASRTKKNWLED